MTMLKRCSFCKIEKDVLLFGKNKSRKDGLHPECKKCVKDRQKQKSEEKSTYDKKRYEMNKDDILSKNRTYRQKNQKSIYIKRIERINSGEISFTEKIAGLLRSRFYKAIKGIVKTGSAVKDLGCSIEEFKIYIESKFQTGMTWDNYGEWHIDHIHPLSKFDLAQREEVLKAVHYTNLQPLWEIDNLRKSNKVA